MAFIFTCGTHTFTSQLKGYEHITAQCQNCGNFSAKVLKRWEWFTFCFVPIIPFSFKPWQELGCPVCRFYQDLKYRPDVQNQVNQGGGQVPLQNYAAGGASGQGGPPQGWASQPPPQQQKQGQPQYA